MLDGIDKLLDELFHLVLEQSEPDAAVLVVMSPKVAKVIETARLAYKGEHIKKLPIFLRHLADRIEKGPQQ